MKKFLVLFLSVSILNSANAIDVNLSRNNLRLNNTATSTSFTVTLSDDIDALEGVGTIPAKLKVKSKGVSSSTSLIEIPYTDGVIGNSDEVTLTLTKELKKSSTTKMKIKLPKKYRKKHKVNNFTKVINLDTDAISLKGKVTIPSGSIDSFRSRTRRKLSRMRDRGVTPFNTENPEGVLVELVEIVPETGEPVMDPEDPGEPLVIASALTDESGDFEMEMPEETPEGEPVDFGTDFVIMVQGDEEGEEMHTPLFSDEVNVNPATEAIFELTQEAIEAPEEIGLPEDEEITFENFTPEEAEGLDEQMEELSPIYEDTLAESLAGIKEAYEKFFNNMLGVAADDDESGEETDLSVTAKGIAGDYNVVFFDSRITSEDRTDIAIQLTSGRMSKPDEVGALIVTPGDGFQTSARAFADEGREEPGDDNGGGPGDDEFGDEPGDDSGSQSVVINDFEEGDDSEDDNNQGGGDGLYGCYDVESESEVTKPRGNQTAGFYMTVDSSNVISFAEAAFEETIENPDGTYIFRTEPGVMNMIPVGDNMFLSSSLSVGESVSPLGVSEYEYTAGFGSIIKKANLEEGALSGNYGLVGLGYEVNANAFGAITFVGDLSFNGNSASYSLNEVALSVDNIGCDGSQYALEVEDDSFSGSANLKYKGDRVSIILPEDEEENTSGLFTGFATADKEVLTLAFAEDQDSRGSRGGSNLVNNAERQLIFGVKKPSSMLNLSGKSYRILSLNFGFNAEGGKTISSGDTGTMTFSSGTVSVSSLTKTVYSKATGSSESVTTASSVVSEADIAYTLSETGSISFTLGSEELTGFVSSDARLIILNSDQDTEFGTYLAVLQD